MRGVACVRAAAAMSERCPRAAGHAGGGLGCQSTHHGLQAFACNHHTHPLLPLTPHSKPLPVQDSTLSYVALHYTDAAGRPAKLRASKEHLVLVHAAPTPASERASEVGPGGTARRADMVVEGDVLVVHSEDGSFYTASVEKITRWVVTG